jgi:pectate lyase
MMYGAPDTVTANTLSMDVLGPTERPTVQLFYTVTAAAAEAAAATSGSNSEGSSSSSSTSCSAATAGAEGNSSTVGTATQQEIEVCTLRDCVFVSIP